MPRTLAIAPLLAAAALLLTMAGPAAPQYAPVKASAAPVLIAQPTVTRRHGAYHLANATARSGLGVSPAFDARRRPGPGPLSPLLEKLGAGLAFSGFWKETGGRIHLNDLYVCGPAGGRFFANDLKGHFTDVTRKVGITPHPGEVGCLFADFANDGLPELVVTGLSGIRFYKNKGDGTFEDWTEKVHMNGTGPVFGAVALDADSDKYLDLFVAGFVDPARVPAGTRSPAGWPAGTPPFDACQARRCFFFRNDGGVGREEKTGPGHMVPAPRPWTGRFTECAAKVGLALDGQRILGGVALDYDVDFRPDLLAVGPQGLHLMHNRGDGTFEETTKEQGLSGVTGALGAAVQDVDGDTLADIVLSGLHGLRLFRAGENGFVEVTKECGLAGIDAALGKDAVTFGVAVVDLDMDTAPEIVAVAGTFGDGPGRWVVARNRGDGKFEDGETALAPSLALPGGARGLSVGDADNDGNPDLAVSTATGAAVLATDEGDINHWLKLRPQGLLCNRDAVGARIRVTFDSGSVTQLVQAGSGYLSAGSREVCMGTGKAAKGTTDIQWPDLRTEQPMYGGTDVAIDKKEGEPSSSCPILFAHDGIGYRYVTDFLGGGVLGLYLGGGQYKLPDPDETIRLPPGALVPVGGRLRLGVLEPLEEIDDFDAFRLAAVDHPAGTEAYPDERLGPPPYPHFNVVGLTDLHPPIAARDGAGRDVLDLVSSEDRRAPEIFPQLPWLGFARRHLLELDLGPLPDRDPVYMVLSGWVEYATSSSIAQAEAAGVLSQIPTLEVADGHGRFVPAPRTLGCPAGAEKTILYRIDGLFPSADHHVRIWTNWKVYWDQIRIGSAVDASLLRVSWLPMGGATLSSGGYPVATTPDGHPPTVYLWDQRVRGSNLGVPAGDYTRYGDVGPLLTAPDDRLVVMKHGDQLELWFSAVAAPALDASMRRTYMLVADGWFKDLDPRTLAHDSVLPLPYHAMACYPPPARGATAGQRAAAARGAQAAARWNTRHLAAIPPLSASLVCTPPGTHGVR